MIYLYGLLPPDARTDAVDLSALAGVTGDVALSPVGMGHLIHGPAPEGEILPKRRLLLAHTRVLEAFNAAGTVLPMRFGMSAPEVAALDAMLERDHDEIEAHFQKLEGATEFGIRIAFDREAALQAVLDDTPALGREHARLARQHPAPHFEAAEFGRRLAAALDDRRTAAQKSALEQLVPFVRDHVLRAPDEDNQILAADVLIARGEESRLETLIEEIATRSSFAPNSQPSLRLVGPVPAYSFVRLMLTLDQSEAA